MAEAEWRYRYVGPADVREASEGGAAGAPIRSLQDFEDWVAAVDARDLAEPFTYVVDVDGVLRLAPRRSEHVACAGGGEVLGAGEMSFARGSDGGWAVNEVSNLSTGYCPDVTSWLAVAAALHRAGLAAPGGFTAAVVFRRCASCQERNVVRDDDFVCAVCGALLPLRWNLDPSHVPSDI
jgi:hypothetical protein